MMVLVQGDEQLERYSIQKAAVARQLLEEVLSLLRGVGQYG